MAADRYSQSVHDSVQLYMEDALRLAATDDVFARTLLDQPEHFVQPFNLTPGQVRAVRLADKRTVEQALTSLHELMENPTTDERVELDMQDVLRLASADDEFAQAVLAFPERFEVPFNLTSQQVEAIRKVESLTDLEDSAMYAS